MTKQKRVFKLEAVLSVVYNQLKGHVLGSVVVFARRHMNARWVSDSGQWPMPPGDYIIIRIPELPLAAGKIPVASTFSVQEISTPAQRGETGAEAPKVDQVAVPAGA